MSDLQAPLSVLTFFVDGLRCAFPSRNVSRVFQAAEITSVPGAPDVINGIVNVRDSLVPVADFRRRLGLNSKALEPDDKFILTNTSRPIIVVVDTIEGLIDLSEQALEEVRSTLPDPMPPPFLGVGKASDGLILIYDLERFLSHEEHSELQTALGNIQQ